MADYFDYSFYDILKAVERLEGKKWRICIPKWAASLTLKSLIWISPTHKWRLNAYSRHRAFFEYNSFSTEKLRSAGFTPRSGGHGERINWIKNLLAYYL